MLFPTYICPGLIWWVGLDAGNTWENCGVSSGLGFGGWETECGWSFLLGKGGVKDLALLPSTALWIQTGSIEFALRCPWVSVSLPQSGKAVACATLCVHPQSWGSLEAGLTPGAIQNSLRAALGCAVFWQSLWDCPILACIWHEEKQEERVTGIIA